jgi:putative transposase
MAHTYASLHYHLVFSTLERRMLIAQNDLGDVWAYIGGIVRNIGGTALAAGGTSNHVHVLAGLPPKLAPAVAAGKIKANSSRWYGGIRPANAGFGWQEGYAGFTVSRSGLDATIAYISNQARHHQTTSFENEYLALLRKHGIEFDKAHVFG